MLMQRIMRLAMGISICATATAQAQNVNITPDVAARSFVLNGKDVTISRVQNPDHQLPAELSKTSRPCPPFCVTPASAAPGVATIGELEVMDFLETHVAKGDGLLIDSRVPDWFRKGTIPGAVNVPFSTLDIANPYRDDILKALGARNSDAGWDFTDALALTLFCNGPWDEQSTRAVQSQTQAGYPPEKIQYYRGGIQLWMLLGLTVRQPVG